LEWATASDWSRSTPEISTWVRKETKRKSPNMHGMRSRKKRLRQVMSIVVV
jgi:hypothetical protein